MKRKHFNNWRGDDHGNVAIAKCYNLTTLIIRCFMFLKLN